MGLCRGSLKLGNDSGFLGISVGAVGAALVVGVGGVGGDAALLPRCFAEESDMFLRAGAPSVSNPPAVALRCPPLKTLKSQKLDELQ